ncbi:MAG: glycosyl transferase [Candidatus Saganbacteria bacterium]|uniref:dolichyl-phosphate beta-glucosyltransferase n=1 Tax=Candidatus Saganbacteria bacterium TaxID=2575572 RepID=A0A833NWB7_UNCSA|nr:MAG: glycosyl transferase [Candidatus Saganbacteria bacterium]
MLSIVIPAYNEEARLPNTLNKTIHYLEDHCFAYEIIVVSDGSVDKTNQIVSEISAQNPKIKLLKNIKNQGKGAGVKKGILAAKGGTVLFMDADNSTEISEIGKFFSYLEGFDIIIGSRALPESKIVDHQFWMREYTGKLFNKVVQAFFMKGIQDTQCGFKLFKRDAAMAIFKRASINGFCFDLEILLIARQLGYKIKEVPVSWTNSKPSKVSFFRSSLSIVADLFRIYNKGQIYKYHN